MPAPGATAVLRLRRLLLWCGVAVLVVVVVVIDSPAGIWPINETGVADANSLQGRRPRRTWA